MVPAGGGTAAHRQWAHLTLEMAHATCYKSVSGEAAAGRVKTWEGSMLRVAASLALLSALFFGCASVPDLSPTPAAPGQTGHPTASATPAASTTPEAATLPPGTPGETTAPASSGPVASSALCGLTSPAELASIFGGTWQETDSSDGCAWTNTDAFTSLTTRFENSSDFSAAQVILGNVQQVTVAGHPAVIGDFLGPILYIQVQPNLQLVLQGVLMATDDATHQQVIQLGTAMVGRL
jgi:hypothetical protein